MHSAITSKKLKYILRTVTTVTSTTTCAKQSLSFSILFLLLVSNQATGRC